MITTIFIILLVIAFIVLFFGLEYGDVGFTALSGMIVLYLSYVLFTTGIEDLDLGVQFMNSQVAIVVFLLGVYIIFKSALFLKQNREESIENIEREE